MANLVRVLIIGGCGYVGRNIALKLLKLNYKVVLYDAKLVYLDLNCENLQQYEHNLQYHEGNILNKNDLLSLTASCKPQVVIHLASYGMSGAAMLSPLCYDINITGVENTIEACLSNEVY